MMNNNQEKMKCYDKFFQSINFDIKLLNGFHTIYVTFSGGHDSTLLVDYISHYYPKKVKIVNCYNPYEMNKTLKEYRHLPNYIEVRPKGKRDYQKILKKSFNQLPKAWEKYLKKEYYKKIFPCCYHIKHKFFERMDLFKSKGSVVISGIKGVDGSQRRIFLSQLRKGKAFIGTSCKINNYEFLKNGITEEIKKTKKQLTKKRKELNKELGYKPSFFLQKANDILYCYPFRDYVHNPNYDKEKRNSDELPDQIILLLKNDHPNLTHSGCQECPVLLINNIQSEKKRYKRSRQRAIKMGFKDLILEIESKVKRK